MRTQALTCSLPWLAFNLGFASALPSGLCLIIANLLTVFFFCLFVFKILDTDSARSLIEIKRLPTIGEVITKSGWQLSGQVHARVNLELSLAPEEDGCGRRQGAWSSEWLQSHLLLPVSKHPHTGAGPAGHELKQGKA